MRRGRAFLVRQANAAAALGHVIRLEDRPPPSDYPEGNHKFWAVCTCGWRSRAAMTHGAALGMGFMHCGHVVSDPEAGRRNGVDTPRDGGLPGSVGAGL